MAKNWLKSRRLLAPCLLGIIFTIASFITWVSDSDVLKQQHSPTWIKQPKILEKNIEIFNSNKRSLLLFSSECESNNLSAKIQENAAPDDSGQFPSDFFTLEQRQRGAVIFHLFGLIYMFIALAIVCDEFFVPSLGVITEKLDISEDVAGATFMAAGGSAPEFFTSVIGVFIAQNNVGIGTIVGSATFNILCVLAFCTLFSTTVLHLTWWPLFRDCTFYIGSLFMLVCFFLDEKIEWYEALSLFLVYLGYASFMKFNVEIENAVKSKLFKQAALPEEVQIEQQSPIMQPPRDKSISFDTEIDHHDHHHHHHNRSSLYRSDSLAIGRRRGSSTRRQSIPILHSGAMFRNGIMQIMSHTLDPLTEGDVSEDRSRNGELTSPESVRRKISSSNRANGNFERLPLKGENGHDKSSHDENQCLYERRSTKAEIEQIKSILEEEEEKPLDMTWPEHWNKQLMYLFLCPILLPLWVTLPDVRKEECRKWYILTFIGSILWIASFSYLMVWWANTIGETFVIPTEIIGLTILAAGTSIPDLITSVIVARKGLGDMAVSSSVGSNIFDVCVGLPVPWLLYFLINLIQYGTVGDPISVSSNGLVCSVGMLFIMIIVLVAAIGCSNWQMNKVFGIVMMISYIAFCFVSVFLETGRFICPLRIC